MAAAAANIDTLELELCIKSLLFSRPTVVKASLLQRECEDELGKTFPFRQLGFPTFVDYLRSIPSVVQLEPHNGYNPDVYPVASRASSHIDQLVSRQRVPPSRRRGVARRGGSQPPIRRRSARVATRPAPRANQRPTPSVVRPNQYSCPFQSSEYRNRAIISSTYPVPLNNGVNVRDLESNMRRKYNERELTRNGLHSMDHLLSYAEGMVERGDTKVYPKLAGASNNLDENYEINGIPAGFEDEIDDFDDEFYDEFDEREMEKDTDREMGKDSEEEMSKEAIQLWSRALGKEESDFPTRSPELVGEASALMSRDEAYEHNVELPEDDSNISSKMISNFRKILNKYPEGIWASQLQQLYFEEFNVALNLLDLGYESAIKLVSSLPSVFTYQRQGSHDWMVYDARYVTQESLDTSENRDIFSSDASRYIPQAIIENIKKLLYENSNGFRSTVLLDKYQETFRKPLNLDILGFNTLEEFLMILKNDVTLKKAQNYYLLLPKHKVVSYEDLEPPNYDDRLTMPVEALCVPIPDDVMKWGDDIPLQALPPVEMDPHPDKPLLELEVMVAEVITPSHFYITLGSKHEELEKMMDDLHKFYCSEEENYQIPLPCLTSNLYCACKYIDHWHRAKVTRIKGNGDIEIEFIDYGTPLTVNRSELRYLSKEFSDLPTQAICAKLTGMKPKNGGTNHTSEACQKFLSLVDGKTLVAHVYQIASRVRQRQEKMQLEMILFDVESSPQIVINDYLIEHGFVSPIPQVHDSSTEIQQPVQSLLPENDIISSQANGSSLSSCGLASLPENGPSSHLGNCSSLPSSSVVALLNTFLSDLSSNNSSPSPPPRFRSLSLHPNKSTQEEKKPRRPPPGFKEISTDPDIYLSTPFPGTSPPYSRSNQTRPTNSMSAEEQHRIYLQNIYLMNSAAAELFQNRQFNLMQQNCPTNPWANQPNASNMPLAGPPLFHSQPQSSLTYGSFAPQPHPHNVYRQQAYQTVPSNIFPVTAAVPVIINTPVIMEPCVPYPYYPVIQQSPVHNMSSRVRDYRPSPVQDISSPPPSDPSKFSHTPSPITFYPATSPAPICTPITVPERPPNVLPVSLTNCSTETNQLPHRSVSASPIKAESPEDNLMPRPCTPLTPASAEVAKICNLSRTSPSASVSVNPHNSTSLSVNSNNSSSSTNSQGNRHLGISTTNSQINENLIENSLIDPPINKSPCSNTMSNFKNENVTFEHDNSRKNSLNKMFQRETEVNEIPLPADIEISAIPLPPPSPEKLYSAISSPVDSLVHISPMKEESSDDYASAAENMEEIRHHLTNLDLSEKQSVPFPCETNNDIPDSWENLELDDTPAKAANFSVDFSQPLDLIIQNAEYESTLKTNNNVVAASCESEVKSQASPPLMIQVPLNWKDVFNPDSISSSERNDNNNIVKVISPKTTKFGVKKIPLQKLESQGKFFHLIYINKVPAVIALEFFKQFVPETMPQVSEKVVEVTFKKFYYISRTDYPAILAELDKLPEFFGGVLKKQVIRLNKIRMINLSDIPECLKILNMPNKPLLDDLKKIANELELC